MRPRSRDQNTVQDRHPTTGHTTGEAGKSEVEANIMQAGRVIPHPREQDNNKHELEEMREGRGLLQRRLRTAFDDPTWSDLAFRCQWPPHDASTRAELLQGSGEEPSSPPSPPSPSPSTSPTRGPAAPELEVYVHRVVVAAWSDALAQLCRLHSNNKEEVGAREGKEEVAGEIRGGGGDGDTTTQDGQQLKVLDVFEKEEEGEPTRRGGRRTVVELQATDPGDSTALRLLLAFLYSGDLAQALDDTAACRLDGSGARSNADHGALVRPHILKSILQDAAGGDDISPADRHAAKMVVARAANLGLGYGVPELHQQFKSSSMWIADTESSPTTPPYHVSADDGLVESPLDALLAAASQHPLVRAGAIPAAESPVTMAEVKLGGFQEGRSLRGSTERRVPARYCSPDVEVYKGTWEVRGKRKPAPAPTSPSPASPTSFSPHTSPPTIGRRSARLMEQELTVAETTADVMAATQEAREAADDDSEQDPDSGSSALDAPHSVARRASRRHSGGLERKPLETDTRKKRRKEEVEEVDEEEEEDDDEYDQRHESMRIIANANKKRRAVAKAKQTRESAATVPPPEDNADEETFSLVETNDHPTVDTTIVPSAKSLPAAALVPRSATELASPRGVGDVAVDQPVVTETQVLAAAAASGQIRRSLKQLRKEHGKNCHNCKTRKIDFVTCLVRPTHRFCDGCLRKLFNVEFANAHAEWDGIVHPEGCAICRHMCPCVGCRKRAHPPASPARNSSDASRKAKRPRDDADATDQHAPQRASGSGHCAAGSGDNDDSPRTKKPRESEKAEKNEKREEKEKKKVKEEKKSSSGSSKRRRTRSLIDGRESTQEKEGEDRVRRSSLDVHEDEDSVEMMTDADSTEHLAAIPPGKSTRSRSRRRESAAAAAGTSTPPPPLHGKSTRSSARRSGGGGGGSRSAAKGFNVPEGAGPEAFLGLVSAGSALSQRPTRRTPIRAPSADD